MTLKPVTMTEEDHPGNPPSDVNAGDLLNELRELLDEKDDLNNTLSKVNKRREEVEYLIQQLAERTGLDSFSNDVLTVSVKKDTVVSYEPERWNDMVAWAVATNNLHIIQRRVSTKPVLELIDNGIEMPEGIKFTEMTRVNTRRK
jgi:hypothetical protein